MTKSKANGAVQEGVSAAPLPPTLALTAEPPSQLVRPMVDSATAKQLWDEYQRLCNEILDENDFTYYVHGRESDGKEIKPAPFSTVKAAEEQVAKATAMKCKDVHIKKRKKRSACDKLAKFYNLTVPMKLDASLCDVKVFLVGPYVVEAQVGEGFSTIIYQDAESLEIIKASVRVSVIAPNGRTEIGEGVCSTKERNAGFKGFAHADHDIPTTAYTRAMNRAILRAIGTGEVSAEEADDMGAPPPQPEPWEAPQPAAPVAQPPTKTEQVTNVAPEPAKVQTPKIEPKKETKKAEALAPEQAPSMGAPNATGVPQAFIPPTGTPDGFTPLGKDAKLSERILHMEKHLYGSAATDSRRESQLVKYSLFLFPHLKAAIETVPGRLNMDKFNEALKAVEPEQRKLRCHFAESTMQFGGREKFKEIVRTGIEQVFGKV